MKTLRLLIPLFILFLTISACGGGGSENNDYVEGPRTVFVTSSTYDGNLGGLSGADDICQGFADGATIEGTFKAWLSDSISSPSTRFIHSTNFPYILVDNTIIADNWEDLIDGSLQNSIGLDENGNDVTDYNYFDVQVWTGTESDGSTAFDNLLWGGNDCAGWTSSNGGSGIYAFNWRVNSWWTFYDQTSMDCFSGSARLYCFQQ